MPSADFSSWPHEHTDLAAGAIRSLRESGGRLTNQRRNILEAFQKASEHPTVEEIFTIAKEHDPGLNLSTVYRTMRWLEAKGLLRGRVFAAAERSERFDTAQPAAHHHFICLQCHSLIEFDVDEIDSITRNFERRYGLKVEQAELVLYGRCAKCRNAENTELVE